MRTLLKRLSYRPFFIRLFHWEYWSFTAVYALIYPLWFLLCLRARSFFFFAAANPGIKNGGFLNESKKEVFGIVPPGHQPKTVFFSHPAVPEVVIRDLQQADLNFPMIGKPDIGGRGRGVKTLKSLDEVKLYVTNALLDFHIQEFVPWPHEAGIFYYRMPGNPKGNISGIVGKEFLSVRGDGVSTIRQILVRDPRAILQMQSLEKMLGTELDTIPAKNVERVIVPYGNHARGAKFLDDSHRVDAALIEIIDNICRPIQGFYFGRLDIRYNSWEELKQGKNFSIIEVNGAGAEPTHMYDPRHSLFFAWKEIIRHWWILYRISRKNHQLGFPYLTFQEGIAMFREDKEVSKKLAAMPE
ncbi:MAG TPA: hypothetical protein VM012_03230 [Flavitalea sp.]|nr:hypothetical protein [Flavitalea sp.]